MTFINIKRLKMDIPSPAIAPMDWDFITHPLLSVVGVYYCYRRNGGAVGVRFAERYLAIGWVVGLRVGLVAASIAAVGLGISLLATGSLEWLEEPRIAPAVTVGSLGLVAFVYWRIGRHLGDLRAAYPA